MIGLCKALDRNPTFIKGIAKMSSKLTVKGQRLELAGEVTDGTSFLSVHLLFS